MRLTQNKRDSVRDIVSVSWVITLLIADDIPDEELPGPYVMYPVTAGGGGRGSSQNANLTQGTFVFGFFMDGEDAQLPVIMGVLRIQ